MSAPLNFLLLAGAFALLFAFAEVLHRALRLPAEATRKIVHVGTGGLTLLFPLLLHSVLQVALLCGIFLVILFVSMQYRVLPSINAIRRKSWGSVLYPLIVCCVYVFYTHYAAVESRLFHPLYYFYTPILVMAICDPLAALAGSAFRRKYPQTPPGKTFAGSFAFFFGAAVLVAALAVYFCQNTLPVQAFVLVSIMLSFIATLAERFSSYGWDNFSIPAGVMLGIYVMESGLRTFAA